jgi:putative transposase
MMSSRQRYLLIDRPKLMGMLKFESEAALKSTYEEWIREALTVKTTGRESKWTESVAVGGKDFVERIKDRLGARAGSREVEIEEDDFVLREKKDYYRSIFARKKGMLSNIIRLKKIRSIF